MTLPHQKFPLNRRQWSEQAAALATPTAQASATGKEGAPDGSLFDLDTILDD